jgi:hypothetical protein
MVYGANGVEHRERRIFHSQCLQIDFGQFRLDLSRSSTRFADPHNSDWHRSAEYQETSLTEPASGTIRPTFCTGTEPLRNSGRLAALSRHLRSCHMASGVSFAALTALFTVLAGCRAATHHAVDPELASCVPENTRVLAGIQIGQVQASPLLEKWFTGSLSAWMPTRDASAMLVAYTGSGLLWATRGPFREPPAGATLLAPQLAVTGSDAAIRAAAAQHASGRTGAPGLVAQAELVATQPVWAVAVGNIQYPLSGNAANLNRLLALTDYTTLTLDARSQIGLHVTGICGSAERARQFEETLRALLSLARAAAHDRDLELVLSAVQIRRDSLTVHVDAAGAPELVERLVRSGVPQ